MDGKEVVQAGQYCGLDEPIMRLRALPSVMLYNVYPSLSGSDQPQGVPSEYLEIVS